MSVGGGGWCVGVGVGSLIVCDGDVAAPTSAGR